MSSFLSKEKTKKSYWMKISTEPKGTQIQKRYAVNNFTRFVNENYESKTINDVIEEIHIVKRNEKENYEQILYEMLQEWINWNEKRRLGNYTIRVVFSNLRKFLFHFGIKTHEQDIRGNLRFGKIPKEERHSLSKDEYKAIIDGFSRDLFNQALFLVLGSSGMRIGEALSLRKKDLDQSNERIKINISTNTKTRRGRSTYISIEAEKKLKLILEKKNQDDFIFGKQNEKPFVANYQRSFSRLVKRIGFHDKYSSNGFNKITTHSFRAYFFTKAVRKHGENYAHRLVGHGGYLTQYDRITEEEKLKMYLELEPELVVYDQTYNEFEIKKLKESNEDIQELRSEVKKLRENQATQDKRILEKLRGSGALPTHNI